MVDFKGLLGYYRTQYWHRTGSIFLEGLVDGMFLAFLLDTNYKCDDKGFIITFLAIATSHFCSDIIVDMADYFKVAAASDGRKTWLERKIEAVIPWFLHVVRIPQFVALVALSYEVLKLLVEEETSSLIHNLEEALAKPGVGFCEGNEVHIALATVVFQFLYGFLILASWTVCWAVEAEGDVGGEEQEEGGSGGREEEAGRENIERTQKGKSVCGLLLKFIRVVGMESFFDEQVSATFLALALALPHESCHIHVTEWFLMAGVVATLTAVVNSLIVEVERILKHPKHRFILFLKAVRFPLFCMELIGFFAIFDLVNIALLAKHICD